MGPEAIFTLLVVVGMLVALVLELWEPDAIFFSALVLLLLTGIINLEEAFAGFANEGMLTVAVLFIVAYAMQSSGILEVAARRVMGTAGDGQRALARMMIPVAALSAFMNNTPIVAMFTPTIRDWALRHKTAPSKLLIPLSYASLFGGICTLIGTSTNIVVNGLFRETTGRSFGMFEFAYVGVPSAVAGLLFMTLIGHRLLPRRPDLSEEFAGDGMREYLLEMQVPEQSRLAGRTVEQAGLRHLGNLYLAQILRDRGNGDILAPVRPTDQLEAGDRLVFTGSWDGIVRLQQITGLVPCHEPEFCQDVSSSGRGRVIEAVVSRSSPMLGRTLREGNFRARYDAAVLAVHRHGERLSSDLGSLVLRPGDTLLLLAGDDFYKRWNQARDFYMVSRLSGVPTVNRTKVLVAVGTLAGMIGLAASGVMGILPAASLAAVTLLATRCITVVEARRSLELNVLVIIAASIGISSALVNSGAAGFLAGGLIGAVEGLGPIGLLAATYLAVSILTELVTNNAAAVLVLPIALTAADRIGADPLPFALAVAVAASASFATPIGYQTNLMVYGPGGYRFTDFMKVGIPLNVLFLGVALVTIPLAWGLT